MERSEIEHYQTENNIILLYDWTRSTVKW